MLPAISGSDKVQPFTIDDYHSYVDGRAREEGIRAFLGSRGLQVPDGSPETADRTLATPG